MLLPPPPPSSEPLTFDQKMTSAIFAALFLGLFIAEMCYNYEPMKLGALLILVFWIPLLVLHESGHALMAAALGWYVGRVVIGMGGTLWTFRVGSASVEVRLLPIEGFCANVPRNLRFPQLKSALIYFAGPGADLLVAAVVLVLIGQDQLFSRSDDYGLIVCQSLAAAAVTQGVLNLIPHAAQTQSGMVANDGLGILRSFVLPDAHYAAMIGQTYNDRTQEWETHDSADDWKRGDDA